MPYDEEGCRVMRSTIERFNAWLKAFRRVVIRYEKLAIMFQAIIAFVCMVYEVWSMINLSMKLLQYKNL
jgi:hypothetical protein